MTTTFLLKVGSKLKTLSSKDLEALNHSELMALAAATADEQRKQLIADALSGTERLYYGRKVIYALEDSLKKMEEKFPGLSCQVRGLVFGNGSN